MPMSPTLSPSSWMNSRESAKIAYARKTSQRAENSRRGNDKSDSGNEVELPHYVDYYDTLGISTTATQRAIKNRFMKLAMTHHPDRNKGKMSKKISKKWAAYCQAYQTLSDPTARKAYDSHSALRAAVTAFYAKFNPYNLTADVIEPVLVKYKGHEVQLLENLHKKYGATPFHKRGTTPPGSPTPEGKSRPRGQTYADSGPPPLYACTPENSPARTRSSSYPSARQWRNLESDSLQRADIRKKIASQAGIVSPFKPEAELVSPVAKKPGLLEKMSSMMDTVTDKIIGDSEVLGAFSPLMKKRAKCIADGASAAAAAALHASACCAYSAAVVALWRQRKKEAVMRSVAVSATAAAFSEYAAASASSCVAVAAAKRAAATAAECARKSRSVARSVALSSHKETETLTQRLKRKMSRGMNKNKGMNHAGSTDMYADEVDSDGDGAGFASGEAGCTPFGALSWARLAFGDGCAPGLGLNVTTARSDQESPEKSLESQVKSRDLIVPAPLLGMPGDPLPGSPGGEGRRERAFQRHFYQAAQQKGGKGGKGAKGKTGGLEVSTLPAVDAELLKERERQSRAWEQRRRRQAELERGSNSNSNSKRKPQVGAGSTAVVVSAAAPIQLSASPAGRAAALAQIVAATAASAASEAIVAVSVFSLRWQLCQTLKTRMQQLEHLSYSSPPAANASAMLNNAMLGGMGGMGGMPPLSIPVLDVDGGKKKHAAHYSSSAMQSPAAAAMTKHESLASSDAPYQTFPEELDVLRHVREQVRGYSM